MSTRKCHMGLDARKFSCTKISTFTVYIYTQPSPYTNIHPAVYFSDDIPVRGFIGHLEEGGFLPHNHKIYLWSHLHFNVEYNEDQVRDNIFYFEGVGVVYNSG